MIFNSILKETLLSNWKNVNSKSVFCTLLPNALAASSAATEQSLLFKTQKNQICLNENNSFEHIQFQIHNSW